MPRWEAYAADGTCYVLKDGALVEAFNVGKKVGENITSYFRTENLLTSQGDEIRKRLLESLKSMTKIADFENEDFYVRERGMHFDGLGAKVDAVGHLQVELSITEKEVASRRAAAQRYLDEIEAYAGLGSFENVRRLAGEGLKHDPSNKNLLTWYDKAVAVMAAGSLEAVIEFDPIFSPGGPDKKSTEEMVKVLSEAANALDGKTKRNMLALIGALKKGYEMQSGEKY